MDQHLCSNCLRLKQMDFHTSFLLLCISIVQLFNFASSAGSVDIFLLKYDNPNGIIADGSPCPSGPNFSSAGPGACRVRLHVCLQSFKKTLPLLDKINVESCPFGSGRTQVLDASYCRSLISSREHLEPNLPRFCARTRVDFSFSWVGSLTAVFEFRHHDTATGKDYTVQRWAKSMQLNPGEGHKNITPESDGEIRSQLAIGVKCSPNYYGPSCSVLCVPRNDNHGHYVCSATGDRTCLPGWNGTRCTEPICHEGCVNGVCVAPDKCRCEIGWQGANCEQCIPYEGCVHGTCEKPFECNCEDRWGGLQCDLDRDYCLHNQPCKNGASCVPHMPNNYTCICATGYAGRDCEQKVSPCWNNPCQHFGTCFVKDGVNQYECVCPKMYTGKHCERISLEGIRTERVESAEVDVTESRNKKPNKEKAVEDPCFYQGEYFPHGTRWDTLDCRQCTCVKGQANCTRAACMAEDCLQNDRGCPVEQVCQSVQNGVCLRGPCKFPVGRCKPWQLADPGGFPELCRERLDLGQKSEECARFHVRLDRDALPRGTSVDSVCFHVTLWLLTKQLNQFTSECKLRKLDAPVIWLQIDLAAIKPRWPVQGLKEHLMTALRQNLTASPVLRAVQTVADQNLSNTPWIDSRGGLRPPGINEQMVGVPDQGTTVTYVSVAAVLLLVVIVFLCLAICILLRRGKINRNDALNSSFGSTTPLDLEDGKSISPNTTTTVGAVKRETERTATEIQWNNLNWGPGGAADKVRGFVTPWTAPGRPEKQCNLWKCGKGTDFEMERRIGTVKPCRVVSRQPEHQMDTVVTKEAVV